MTNDSCITPKERLANSRRIAEDNANIAVKAMGMLAECQQKLSDLVNVVAIYGGLLHDDRCLHSPNEYPDDCWRDKSHDETRPARDLLAKQKETKLYN